MSDLALWLERHGLAEFEELFAREQIEFGDLHYLSEDDLRELGLPMGPRKRLFAALQHERETSGASAEARPSTSALSPLSFTPPGVAERILGARPSIEGERKQITILFADIKGSTRMVEQLDPEEATALLDPLIVRMIDAVHRYDGTVNRVQGDGIMAMFGAPLAHEDHALRACRAALDIRDAGRAPGGVDRPPIELRVGINSGEVVVRSIHNDLTMSYDAVGLTAHLAARMEQLATPGTICLTSDTLRHVEGFVIAPSRGFSPVKGLSAPLEVFTLEALTGARTRVDARPGGELTPFVGRRRELEIIDDCFASADASRGRVVLVIGEPGMGKSRLLLEARRRLGERIAWIEGHALSFAHSMPFHPLPEMLRGYFAIDDDDSDDLIGEKLRRAVAPLGPDCLSAIPYLRFLLGMEPASKSVADMDPQLRRAETFDAIRRVLLAAASKRPHVLVVEDLHWADPATEELIMFLVGNVPGNRLLFLLTYRPTYHQRLGEQTFVTRLVLDALEADAAAEMARGVLRMERLPVEVERLVHRQAEGNPLFVEEVMRTVLERSGRRALDEGVALPVEEMRVPETIQGVIMARVDHLEETPRRTLQLASVLGREFTSQTLELISELSNENGATPAVLDWLSEIAGQSSEALRQAQAVELVYERAAGTYVFKHALTQEVVYGSLLLERRRELHRFAGVALERTLGHRASEHLEHLAFHFSQGEAWDRALDCMIRAARRSTDAFATREAITLYEQALECADRLPETLAAEHRISIHQAKADQHLLVSEFEQARREASQALALARRASDRRAEGTALVSMSRASWLNHEFEQALIDADEAVAVGSTIGDPSIVAGGHLSTGLVYEMTGRLEEAGEKLDTVVQISRDAGDAVNESWALVFAAEIKGWEASFDEASRLYLQGIRTARSHGVLLPQLEGLFMYGINLTGKGQYESAFAAFEEGLDLAEKVGDENYTPRYLNSLGWLCAEIGDFDRAVDLNRRGADGARAGRDDEAVANANLNLADIALARDDLGLAHDLLDTVHRAVRDPATSEWMRWRYSMHLFTSLAELAVARRDPPAARAHAERCLELAQRTNSRKYAVHGWRLKGAAAELDCRWEDAEAALLKALPVAETIASPTPLWKTHWSLARIKHARREQEAANAHYRAATSVIDALSAGVRDGVIAETLACSPTIRAMREQGEMFGR